MHVPYLWIVLATCYSVYAKVVVHDDKLPNIQRNSVENSIKDSEKTYVFKCSDEDKCTFNKKVQSKPEYNIINVTDNDVDKDPVNVIELPVKTKLKQSNENSFDDNFVDESKEDNGAPVFITPFIESHRFQEARDASKVDSELFFGIESYTGFITVNKTYNSNIFFWYFPIKDKPVNETPWLIWLQGGPGASSMTGLFDELGPFTVNKGGILKKNPYTWLRNHSLLFIDNPVGTGFSFTDNDLGYARDMETYSKHLYLTVEQFLQIFPELRTAPLYVSGESYGGKYVPCLAMELHKHKTSSALDVNLQGVIVGNGYIEPSMIANLPRLFYNFGIIQKEQIEILKPLHDGVLRDIAANRSVAAKNNWSNLIMVLLIMSHQTQAYNFLKDELTIGHYAQFLKRSDVRRAIHVGDRAFSFINLTCNSNLASDFLTSTQNYYETLLENYRILLYCGHLDQMLPCVSAAESHNKWRWTQAEEFAKSIRHPFIFNGKVAGYHKSGGGFTEVVIRGAGHMVPVDTPEAIQSLVSSWTHLRPLSTNNVLQTLLDQFIKNTTMIYL